LYDFGHFLQEIKRAMGYLCVAVLDKAFFITNCI